MKHAANPKGHIVAKVPNGEIMQVLAHHGDYAHVRWQHLEGFVRADNFIRQDLSSISMGSFARQSPLSST